MTAIELTDRAILGRPHDHGRSHARGLNVSGAVRRSESTQEPCAEARSPKSDSAPSGGPFGGRSVPPRVRI